MSQLSNFYEYRNAPHHAFWYKYCRGSLWKGLLVTRENTCAFKDLHYFLFFNFSDSIIRAVNFFPNKFWWCFWSNAAFAFLESFMRLGSKFCRLWYEIRFEACSSNNIVFYCNVWKQPRGNVTVSSGDFLKSSNPFQRSENESMILKSFFWNFSRLVSIAKRIHNFTDDNTVSAWANTISDLINKLESDINIAAELFKMNKMIVNPDKFQAIVLNKKRSYLTNTNFQDANQVIKSVSPVVELLSTQISTTVLWSGCSKVLSQ